jgi:hypothetical protein
LIVHNADGDRVVNIEFKQPKNNSTPIKYLICGMDYDEAERYCEYVSQNCNADTGYCTKDEVLGS